MKSITNIVLLAGMMLFYSCNKSEITILPMGTINIVNAVVGGTTVKMGTALRDSAAVNSYRRWSFISGNTEFRVFPTNNPSAPYFDQTVQTREGEWYSLYLTGQAPTVESVFLKETLPVFQAEQCALRVVNLSPNGSGLNVVLSATPGVSEFSGVTYKQVTAYKTYPLPFGTLPAQFVFEVRDASGPSVLASYAFTTANLNGIRYDSATLVIRGMVGGTGANALALMYVPHY